MDYYKSGKTIRFINKGKKKDNSVFVNVKNPNGNPIEVLGYEFHPGLLYSTKKKQRWQVLENISSEAHTEDIPILHTKHQCIYDDWPSLDVYLFDSLSNITIGNIDVSNKKLEQGRFNVRSAVHQIESMNDYTDKEKISFEKTKRKMKNIKKGRITAKEVIDMSDELPPKAESLENKEARENCVYVHEFIHVNDLSRVNIVRPYSYKYSKNKNVKKLAPINVNSDDYRKISGEYSDEYSDEEVFINPETKKPFLMADCDFICRRKEARRDRKRQRPNKRLNTPKNLLKENKLVPNCYQDAVLIVYDDILPSTVVNLSHDQFVVELGSLMSFFKCWQCCITPLTILIDLDEFEESTEKSFLILRPSVENGDNVISVKVLVNVSNGGFDQNEVLNPIFESLLTLVAVIQSQLISGKGDKLLMLPKAVILDGSIDEVSYLPTVKSVDSGHYLYLYHEEWKNCKLNIDNIESVMKVNETLNYSVDICSQCGCSIPDDEMIVIDQCQHQVCQECLSRHIIKRLDAYNIDIDCPHNDCVVKLDAPTILSLVSWGHYRLRLSVLEVVMSSRCGVPCTGCGLILMIDNSENRMSNNVIEYKCTCGKTVCSGCGESQHRPSSCQEMKTHNIKMNQLLDKENDRLRIEPVICTKMINCCSCARMIYQHWVKPYRKCPCNKAFCNVCYSAYKSHIIECKIYTEVKQTFPNSTMIVPFQEAKSSGLKLYNQSVYLSLLLHKDNMFRFKCDLYGAVSLVTQTRSYSVDEFTRSYSQVLRMLESMYVSAYNTWRRTNVDRWRQLRVAIDQLMFYVGRIQALSDEINGVMRSPGAVNVAKRQTIGEKYARLESYIDDAHTYARKSVIVLRCE